jgi:DNA-binding NarL/FixJ family response regulator
MDLDGRQSPLRVVIVDNHAISRAACRALLRTEGVEVLAGMPFVAKADVCAEALLSSR